MPLAMARADGMLSEESAVSIHSLGFLRRTQGYAGLVTRTNYHIGCSGLLFDDICVRQVAVDQPRIGVLLGNGAAPLFVAHEEGVFIFRVRLVQRVQGLAAYVSRGPSPIPVSF